MKIAKYLLLILIVALVFSGCGSRSDETYNENTANNEYQSDETVNIVQSDNTDTAETINDNELTSEWINSHPWREDYNVETMPVFRNPFHMIPAEYVQHEGLSANSLSDEEMTVIAENIIIAMGLEVYSIDTANRHDTMWGQGVTATAENVRVTVESHGFAQVVFENGLPLPEGIIFSWEYPNDEALVYLTERFAPILGIERTVFENNATDIVERILDYHFNDIQFIPNSNGELGRISKFPPRNIVLTDKIGDFPIITPSEAVERMLDGQGSFGVDMGQTQPTVDDIIDMRLVYFGHNLGRNYLEEFAPWYELIVLTADTHHVQSYFVPAVRLDYLEANPAWSVYPHQ